MRTPALMLQHHRAKWLGGSGSSRVLRSKTVIIRTVHQSIDPAAIASTTTSPLANHWCYPLRKD